MSLVRELAVYTIKPIYLKGFHNHLIDSFRRDVSRLPGCMAYETLSDSQQDNRFSDIVTWRSLSDAKKAQRQIALWLQSSAKEYFAMFEQVEFMSHFYPHSDWCQEQVSDKNYRTAV